MSFSLIFTVLFVVLLIALIWYVTKFFVKVFIFISILFVGLGYLYTNNIGPFKKESIDINLLKEKYCKENKDEDICDCIVSIIERDVDTISVDSSNDKFLIHKSIIDTYNESLECLEKRNVKSKYKIFLVDISGLSNWSLPDSLEFKSKEISNKLLEKFN